jgi:hypothetical protein
MVAGHLTPEVHVNKNGVPVIKHVNNTPAANSLGKASLPAPAQTRTGSSADVAERAIKEFESMVPEFLPVTLHENFRYLSEHHPKMLNRIMDEVRVATEAEANVWKFVLNEAIDYKNIPSGDEEYEKEEYLHMQMSSLKTHIENVPLAVQLFPDDSPHMQGVNAYRLATRAYQVTRWGPSSGKYVETQAVMILGRTSDYKMDRIGGHGDDIWFIADNMEKVLPLLPELMKRQQTSKGLIESLLSVDSPALLDGAL